MSKYFPSQTYAPAEVIETEALNSEFRSAVSIINRLDRENFAKNIIDDVKMVPEACNSFYTDYHEGPFTYDSQNVSPGWWNVPHLTYTITTAEGIMRGAFSGTIEKYCHDTGASDYDNPYRVGIFVDGSLVAETDYIFQHIYGHNTAWVVPVIAGQHVINIAVNMEVRPPTLGGTNPDDIMKVHDTLTWIRILKR